MIPFLTNLSNNMVPSSSPAPPLSSVPAPVVNHQGLALALAGEATPTPETELADCLAHFKQVKQIDLLDSEIVYASLDGKYAVARLS